MDDRELLPLNNRAIFEPRAAAQSFRLQRLLPQGPAAAYIRHYWLIEWNLPPGAVHTQEVLEHPTVNVVLQPGRSVVSVAGAERSQQRLEGRDEVLGMLFRPGLFRRWLDRDPGELAGRRLPAEQVLGPGVLELERAVFAEPDSSRRAALVDAFWAERLAEPGTLPCFRTTSDPTSDPPSDPEPDPTSDPTPDPTFDPASDPTPASAPPAPVPSGSVSFAPASLGAAPETDPSKMAPSRSAAPGTDHSKRAPSGSASLAPDPSAQLADRIVTGIQLDRSQRSAREVAARWGLSPRSLQRLFRAYIGMTPQAVIRRYRLHETMGLASGDPDWASLALELGYFDQAHLIRDFKAVVGMTPGSYAKRITSEER